MAQSSVALEAFASALAGALGSIVSKLCTYPLDFLKVKLSVKKKEETWGSIVSAVLKQYGVMGLYMGITPKLAKSAAQKFIYFYFSEALLQVRLRLSPVPVGALQELGLSLLADYGCVPVVVPLEAITTQVQTSSDGAGMLRTAGRMYKQSGVGGFFDGWSACEFYRATIPIRCAH